MTLNVPAGVASLLERRRHYLVKCWLITRKDLTTFRLTEHNRSLSFKVPGEEIEFTYSPVGGFVGTAVQREAQLKVQNAEYQGIISSDKITANDLRKGLYDDAEIKEYLVDWTVPWAGPLVSVQYWIDSVSFSGEFWEAQISGWGRWLEPIIVHIYERQCRHKLFARPDGSDAGGCNVDRFGFLRGDVSVDTVTDRENFTAVDGDITTPNEDGYFDFGLVIWTTGNNVGFENEIRTYLNSGRTFSLQLPTPEDIQVGDTFDLEPGCNKTLDHCINKFDNIEHFGGFPFIPGEDKTRQFPFD